MTSNNGGPAFPGEPNMRFGESNEYNEGMNLRDYFAAKAMQAYITAHVNGGTEGSTFDRLVSKWAYETADAMLAAREGDKA